MFVQQLEESTDRGYECFEGPFEQTGVTDVLTQCQAWTGDAKLGVSIAMGTPRNGWSMMEKKPLKRMITTPKWQFYQSSRR